MAQVEGLCRIIRNYDSETELHATWEEVELGAQQLACNYLKKHFPQFCLIKSFALIERCPDFGLVALPMDVDVLALHFCKKDESLLISDGFVELVDSNTTTRLFRHEDGQLVEFWLKLPRYLLNSYQHSQPRANCEDEYCSPQFNAILMLAHASFHGLMDRIRYRLGIALEVAISGFQPCMEIAKLFGIEAAYNTWYDCNRFLVESFSEAI
ncbi:MAG TPA: hypothetical protein VF791_03430 [Pyrinomonadaceae bacterium]